MADPLVCLATYAATRGFINFSTLDYTKRWWISCDLRLRAAAHSISEKIFTAQLQRFSVDAGFDNAAGEALQGLEKAVKPWSSLASNEDDLDLAARWYMLAAPELLKQRGVALDGP